MSDINKQLIQPQPTTPTCPHCGQDLQGVAENRVGGRIVITLMCSRHGTINMGWKPKFMDRVRAQQWAARERMIRGRR